MMRAIGKRRVGVMVLSGICFSASYQPVMSKPANFSPSSYPPLTHTPTHPYTHARAHPTYRGIGGLALPAGESLDKLLSALKRNHFNHLQVSLPLGEADLKERIRKCQKVGFTVFGYDVAFVEQRGPGKDYQIKADGTLKEGWVCPRSAKRLAEMEAIAEKIVDAGADGLIWDYITVESTTLEACFCDRCVSAVNRATGTQYNREQLARALGTDGGVLNTWRKVREESTTSAMRQIVEHAHQYAASKGRSFLIGGYTIGPGSDLGMDPVALANVLDLSCPMIYQGHERAGLGWMKNQAESFVKMKGTCKTVVCVDTGFWVDQPVDELVATTWDCFRAKTDGFALWPYQPVSAEDMAAVGTVNLLAGRFYEPLRQGKLTAAADGMRQMLKQFHQETSSFGSTASKGLDAEVNSLAERIAHTEEPPDSSGFLDTVSRWLLLWSQARAKELHRNDRVYRLPPCEIILSPISGTLTAKAPGYTLAQNNVAENIDELNFDGLCGNASTDAYNLGLFRARVLDWFDGWGTPNQVKVEEATSQRLTVSTTIAGASCSIIRRMTFQRENPWVDVELVVKNTGKKTHKGRLWVWNGIGIPGFLESDPQRPWSDDHCKVLPENILLVADEGRFVAIAADPEKLKLGSRGDDGASHAFCDLALEPGATFATRLSFTAGAGHPEEWEKRKRSLSRGL